MYAPQLDSEDDKINKIHDALWHLFVSVMYIFNFALILFLFLDPLGIILLGSILPPKFVPLPIKLISYLFHAFGISCLVASGVITVGFVFTYLFYVTLFYTTELRLGLPKHKYKSIRLLRENSEKLQHMYRAFQILHKYVMKIFGPYILCFNALFMINSIYLKVVLTKFWVKVQTYVKLPLVLGDILTLVIWISVLEFGRIMFSRGSKVISSWKGGKWKSRYENRIMKKFTISCKPLLLAYGTQFVIKRGNLFEFFKGITRGTIRALLTIK